MRCLCWKSQPGHAWCRSHSPEPTGVSKQRAGQGVQLHGIIVHGPNGTVYDLSSAFNPDVDDYGTSVPPSFVNGSLCILPGNGKAPAQDVISFLSVQQLLSGNWLTQSPQPWIYPVREQAICRARRHMHWLSTCRKLTCRCLCRCSGGAGVHTRRVGPAADQGPGGRSSIAQQAVSLTSRLSWYAAYTICFDSKRSCGVIESADLLFWLSQD